MRKLIGISIVLSALINPLLAEDVVIKKPLIQTELTTDDITGKVRELEYTLELKVGWNLIGLPGYKPYIMADFFGNKEYVNKIYVYNADTQLWQLFSNIDGDEISVKSLIPGMGYWVSIKKPFAISFKTNLPAQAAVYEKAAVRIPGVDSNVTNGNPITVSSIDYKDAFGDDGKVTDDFVARKGILDWDNIKPSEYKEANWDNGFSFDINLVANTEWKDQNGILYRMVTDDEMTGNLTIIADGKTIEGQFLIDPKTGTLNLQYIENGNTEVSTISLDLLETMDNENEVELRLKNINTNQPHKWTLVRYYKDEEGTWIDVKEFFEGSVDDETFTTFNWSEKTNFKEDKEFSKFKAGSFGKVDSSNIKIEGGFKRPDDRRPPPPEKAAPPPEKAAPPPEERNAQEDNNVK